MMTWTDEHIGQWCLRWQTYRQDTQAQTHARALQHQRHQARQEMLTQLHVLEQ